MPEHNTPQSLEAERALLGGLLQAPEEMDHVRSLLQPEQFYRSDHAALFELLRSMRDEGAPIDGATVAERVHRGGREAEFGGLDYVMQLQTEAPATANLAYYAEIVREKARRRLLLRTLRELTEETSLESEDTSRMVDRSASRLLGLLDSEESVGWQRVGSVIDQEIERIDARYRNSGETTGLSTGFDGLDGKLGGLHPETLVIVAARPGMGKTVLALNIARQVALQGRGVGIFSLEMGREELISRLLSDVGAVDGKKIRTGDLSPEEWQRLDSANQKLRETRLYFDDTPGITLGDLRARARRLKALHDDLGLIVIDYLQLMQGDGRTPSRQEQVSEISRGLKMLSKELKIPVMALSQLNREVDKRKEDDRRPRLSDLRESGAIEQDADVILFIYRHAQYVKDLDPIDAKKAEVIVAKHRAGETGVVPLVFLGSYARFGDQSEDYDFRT